jgi:5-(carboxyamino)imidazole ribonucleotide synthase
MSLSLRIARSGDWLGLLGGGQLGRMFCMAAQSLGFRVMVLDPGADSPAGTVADRHLQADYADDAALQTLGDRCVAVTTEFENVPARALEALALRTTVSPAAFAVAVAQNRLDEKRFVEGCGVAVAPHAAIAQASDISPALDPLLPGILKINQLGYDGKGQTAVKTLDELTAAFAEQGRVPCILEKRLNLRQEVSVIVARDRKGETTTFPVAENKHLNGILATSIVPARIGDAIQKQARQAATLLAQRLDYVGVLCVEFFVLDDGSLLVNELAPRPHNSGHYSMDACVTSQFEQQARIVAGLPLGDTRQHSPAIMLNLLGDIWFRSGGAEDDPVEPDWTAVLKIPQVKLHLYGKTEPRPGRKMGHITCVAPTLTAALLAADKVRALLGITAR